ncbi:NAD(P)-binding protein [Prochlorococcus marinus]|uniref:NAD(P)-binding protein n=1 Tax=Prochlorococcus marinus TaxID=1219 RepID=UPI0007B32EC7|nr:NAD(P)-binding protein [Prochlorococcus marinus]KZR78112.1 hypothetical protein PMIT1320_00194 [Prochlorococcus marinus str. MIT 1320]
MKNGLVVIGGGLAGITTAIKKKNDYEDVIIVEKTNQIGGLLNGIKIGRDQFPIGAHFLRKTGIRDIDETIFPNTFEWDQLEYLKTAATSFGKLDTDTGYLNINHGSLSVRFSAYKALIKGWMSKVDDNRIFYSELERIETIYGKEIATVYNDLSKRYFGIDIEEQIEGSLAPLACTQRIKAFTKIGTRYLKKIEYFDNTISYHNAKEGSVYYSNFVPKGLRYQEWWQGVEKLLMCNGIKILKNTKVSFDATKNKYYVNHSGEAASEGIEYFENCEIIDTTNRKKTFRTQMSQTILLFYGCDSDPLIENHFISSFTKRDVFSRITLCHNINRAHKGIVVEIVVPITADVGTALVSEKCIAQMREYKIIDLDTKIKLLKSINLWGAGFQPKIISRNESTISHSDKGISSGNVWFMNEVIND